MADLTRRVGPDERAVSTVLGYALNLVVATLLVTGLLVAAGSLVADQRERTVRAELEVVGARLAADVETADRLARAADDGHVVVRSDLPRQVSGVQYRLRVVEAPSPAVIATTTDPAVRVRVPIHNVTPIAAATLRGGPVRVTWNESGPVVVHRGS
ncbi:MAG: hypothetical protein ABEJ77_05920 [Halanaeroarchaeum sp.]